MNNNTTAKELSQQLSQRDKFSGNIKDLKTSLETFMNNNNEVQIETDTNVFKLLPVSKPVPVNFKNIQKWLAATHGEAEATKIVSTIKTKRKEEMDQNKDKSQQTRKKLKICKK